MPPDEALPALIQQAHDQAVAAGLDFYIDPYTGYQVWTACYLRQRPCCQSACRHCPYGFTQASRPA